MTLCVYGEDVLLSPLRQPRQRPPVVHQQALPRDPKQLVDQLLGLAATPESEDSSVEQRRIIGVCTPRCEEYLGPREVEQASRQSVVDGVALRRGDEHVVLETDDDIEVAYDEGSARKGQLVPSWMEVARVEQRLLLDMQLVATRVRRGEPLEARQRLGLHLRPAREGEQRDARLPHEVAGEQNLSRPRAERGAARLQAGGSAVRRPRQPPAAQRAHKAAERRGALAHVAVTGVVAVARAVRKAERAAGAGDVLGFAGVDVPVGYLPSPVAGRKPPAAPVPPLAVRQLTHQKVQCVRPAASAVPVPLPAQAWRVPE
mmetsp:Transcript_21594/g.68415  ORF Transcript_21594/g.68415 Transcript_21594/m.68415 type:complete len:316 (-) Transcript_21594:1214-2161(-)